MFHVSSVLRIAVWLIWVLLATSASSGLQQTKRPEASPTQNTRATPTPDDRIDRPTSDPYTGSLSVFEDPKRAEKLQIDRVMDLLAIREGSVVADIGAGSGWFTVRAARRVGPTGTVYAVEINEAYLNHIKKRVEKEGLSNTRPILGKEDDPLLPSGETDSILLLKTYHEFSKPLGMLRAMRKAMRKDALLGIIDRDGTGDDHGVDGQAVIKEVSRAGFTLISEHDFVKGDDMDYFLVFRKTNAP